MAGASTRRRSSRRTPRLDFAAIQITGALLTPDIVARIASFDAADQTEEAYGVPPGLKIRDEIARYFRIAEALWHQFEAARAKSPAASDQQGRAGIPGSPRGSWWSRADRDRARPI